MTAKEIQATQKKTITDLKARKNVLIISNKRQATEIDELQEIRNAAIKDLKILETKYNELQEKFDATILRNKEVYEQLQAAATHISQLEKILAAYLNASILTKERNS